MKELNWYSTVPSFADFHQLTQDEHFRRVPPTWSLIVTCCTADEIAVKETPLIFFAIDSYTLVDYASTRWRIHGNTRACAPWRWRCRQRTSE